MGRMTFVFRRLLQLVPVAIGCTIVAFFMIHLIPGDPAATILGIHATPQKVALLHQQWGLNRPLISQYWLFMDRLLHGNLGVSLYYGGSALSLILTHLPPTRSWRSSTTRPMPTPRPPTCMVSSSLRSATTTWRTFG